MWIEHEGPAVRGGQNAFIPAVDSVVQSGWKESTPHDVVFILLSRNIHDNSLGRKYLNWFFWVWKLTDIHGKKDFFWNKLKTKKKKKTKSLSGLAGWSQWLRLCACTVVEYTGLSLVGVLQVHPMWHSQKKKERETASHNPASLLILEKYFPTLHSLVRWGVIPARKTCGLLEPKVIGADTYRIA